MSHYFYRVPTHSKLLIFKTITKLLQSILPDLQPYSNSMVAWLDYGAVTRPKPVCFCVNNAPRQTGDCMPSTR